MEFGLSQEQHLLQDTVNRYLESAASLQRVRQAVEGDSFIVEQLAAGLHELGVSGLLVPEEFGGLGLTVMDAVLIQEVLGRYVAPVDFTASTAMAVIGIRNSGSEDQQRYWLEEIASGNARFAVAISEWAGARDGAGVCVHNGKLTGKSLFVLGTETATHTLVVDMAGGVHIVEHEAQGSTRRVLTSIDKTRLLTVLMVDGTPAETLAESSREGTAADKMLLVGRTLLAADSLGAAWTMLEKSVAYSLERKQFNRTIGSFQAVKHMCAEMAAELEPCRSLVWYAGYAADAVPDEAELMSCYAKSHLAEVSQFVARTATEVHGGVGFTDELGLHYWFKRIGVNRQLLGSPERIRVHAARLQGWRG
ncbi:MAG: acyl-CoA dehydrogenase family protein [Marinobacter sp.]